MNQLLTPSDVCDFLRISKRTLYRMIKNREIPCIKIHGSWRFRVEDINSFIEGALDAKTSKKASE